MSYQVFNRLLEEKNATVYRVAKETGIPASTFTDWKNGRSVPKADKMIKIANFFGVSLDVLLGADGAHGEETASPNTGKLIPIIGEIRAGSPIITNETLLGREYADVDDADEYFYLKVRGDSMKNIGMIDGSIVLFRTQQYAEFFAVSREGKRHQVPRRTSAAGEMGRTYVGAGQQRKGRFDSLAEWICCFWNGRRDDRSWHELRRDQGRAGNG